MSAPPFPSVAERHDASRRLYVARELVGYMSFFSPDLAYRQANGKVVGLRQLTNDVEEQFRRLGAVDWVSRVESEERSPDQVIEVVSQTGTIVTTAFGLLHRMWRLDRRGRYTWRVHDGRWRIAQVDVLEERVVGAGFKFGRRPRLADVASP
jgi:hypothetical protein